MFPSQKDKRVKMGPDQQDREKASVAQAERELKALKAEKATLTKELEEVRSLYKQLVGEGPLESFHERRVHLLKSQVIQLERRLLLQSDALSSRAEVLLLVENSLQTIVDQLRDHLASDGKGPSVPIQRSQLTGLIQTAEGARLRLFKNVETNNVERLCGPILYMGSFLNPSAEQDGVTLLDVCSGKIEHLNLKQVAKLESKLFSLHGQLQALNQSLTSIWSCDPHQPMPSPSHLPLAVNQRLSGLVAQCQRSIAERCSDLLSLSILIPSAPWPLITKPVSCELSLDSVMSALPGFPRSKQQQGRACIDALLKACNYSRNVAKLEAKACADELHFHQSVYDIQMKYMESLFTAIREAYDEFEQSTQTFLCQPLTKILQAYSSLASSSSEDALRDFLTTFKTHANELEKVVDMLTIGNNSPSYGHEALSTFGRDFFASVDTLVQKCSLERDHLAKEIDAVKKMEEDHRKHGLKVLERPKQGSQNAKEDYQEAIHEMNAAAISVTGAELAYGKEDISDTNYPATDTAGTTVTTSSDKGSSPKPTSVSSPSGKTAKEGTDMKVRKGPRVIAKLGGSIGLDDVLNEAGYIQPLATRKDIPTPVQKGVEWEGGSHPSTASSRIPRSGSLSRLKPPSPRHSPMPSKTKVGSRQTGIPQSCKEVGFRSSPSVASGVKRSASEGSRLSFKASSAKPGS